MTTLNVFLQDAEKFRQKGRERPGALLARRAEEGMEPDDLSVLAQRAASEGPRLGKWHVSACQWVGG